MCVRLWDRHGMSGRFLGLHFGFGLVCLGSLGWVGGVSVLVVFVINGTFCSPAFCVRSVGCDGESESIAPEIPAHNICAFW